MKKVLNIIVVIAILAAIVFVLRKNKSSNQEKTQIASVVSTAVPVQIEAVSESKYTTDFTSNGVLQPKKFLTHISDVSGIIRSIKVDKGSKIRKGDILLQVDDEMLKADFDASEAAYNSLKVDYERFKTINESGGVSKQQLDNIRTQLSGAESRYISSKRRLEDATVKAPMSGTINEKYIEEGALLNPGARLFDIVDDSQLKMKTNITADKVLKLSKGQQVLIQSDVIPGINFNGTISFIGIIADRGLNFPIEIVIDQKDALKAGMYVTAKFKSNEESTAIIIPRNAVSGSVKSASVYVVKNGIAHKRDILVGDMIDKNVVILKGLHAGDSIVTAGLINVSEGAQVIHKN